MVGEDSCTNDTQFNMLTVFVEMTYQRDKLPGIVLTRYKGLVLLLKSGVRDISGQSVEKQISTGTYYSIEDSQKQGPALCCYKRFFLSLIEECYHPLSVDTPSGRLDN